MTKRPIGGENAWRFLAADALLAVLTSALSLLIRYDQSLADLHGLQQMLFIPFALLIRPVLNRLLGLDRRMWRYASVRDIGRIVVVATAGSIVLVAIVFGLLIPLGIAVGFPRSVIVIEWLLSVFGTGSVRFLVRLRRETRPDDGARVEPVSRAERRRVLIIGAGDVGATIIREIQRDAFRKFVAVGLVDDDVSKKGKSIYSVPVLGTRRDIPELVADHRIADIVIAMPSAGARSIRETIQICEESHTRVRVQTVPALCEILDGDVSTPHLRRLRPESPSAGDSLEQRLEHAKRHFAGRDVLVTGGNGFIGAHLARRLREFGAQVTVFDVSEGPGDGIHHVVGDVRDEEAIERATPEGCIVFHLAAVLGVENILRAPLDVMEVNLRGTMNTLNVALRKNAERFVMASSSEVYGQPQFVPIREDSPVAPRSIYGISKLAAEAYCLAFSEESGLKTTCVRFFNVYGPGQSERFVVPVFLQRVAKEQPPIIYGDGAQYRSYTYVSDAVTGIVLAASHPNGLNDTFNIGNTQTLTVNELAQMAIDLSGKPLSPVYRSFGDRIRSREREILSREPDISKARNLLMFEPVVTIAEGLRLQYATYAECDR